MPVNPGSPVTPLKPGKPSGPGSPGGPNKQWKGSLICYNLTQIHILYIVLTCNTDQQVQHLERLSELAGSGYCIDLSFICYLGENTFRS